MTALLFLPGEKSDRDPEQESASANEQRADDEKRKQRPPSDLPMPERCQQNDHRGRSTQDCDHTGYSSEQIL
jgi:hypothetical protein